MLTSYATDSRRQGSVCIHGLPREPIRNRRKENAHDVNFLIRRGTKSRARQFLLAERLVDSAEGRRLQVDLGIPVYIEGVT